MPKPTLADLQLRFKEVVQKKAPLLREVLLPKADLDARLNVYQYAYAERILESLREDFQTVRGIVGAESFDEIARKYMQFYPSRFWTLAEYSADFPKFLDNHVDNPFLHDLAQFEWFKIKCSLGPTALQFDPRVLAEATEEDWIGARLRLVSTLKIFSSHWPVNEVELLKTGGQALRGGKIYYYALYRSTRGLQILNLSKNEVELLQEMGFGKSFGELAQSFEKNQMSLDQVSQTVARWVQEGLIEKVVFVERKKS
jgi:hypothetical protein